MLLHAFPLSSASSSSFNVRGPLWGTSVCNFACLFRLPILLGCFACKLSLVRRFFEMSYLEKTIERLGFKITFNPPGDGDCFFGSSGQQQGQLEIESQNS